MKYQATEQQTQQIQRAFKYHSPKEDQPERYEFIRSNARQLAECMVGNCPPSRELSSALTRLEEAVMHANAAIARNE